MVDGRIWAWFPVQSVTVTVDAVVGGMVIAASVVEGVEAVEGVVLPEGADGATRVVAGSAGVAAPVRPAAG
jgi:hypothetical protein